jgi:hypothetical protein
MSTLEQRLLNPAASPCPRRDQYQAFVLWYYNTHADANHQAVTYAQMGQWITKEIISGAIRAWCHLHPS